jgi:hypothetical protein
MIRCCPSAASLRNSAIVSARTIGSRPLSGSSRINTAGSCAIDCASRNALSHSLAVAGDFSIRSVDEINAFQCHLCQLVCTGRRS